MLIGIAGKKQVGKNTVASMLQYLFASKEHREFIILPIAFMLKNATADILHCKKERLEDEWFKELPISWLNNITVREFLQKLGTEVGRTIDKDLWINAYLRKIDPNADIIVPDIRFQNEANKIKEYKPGNIIIKVVKDTELKDNHISETSSDTIEGDYIIHNNKSFSDLYRRVSDIYHKL